jgi:formate C-acetyltransferase
MSAVATRLAYAERIRRLRETKLRHTQEKQAVIGSMDHDDWALVLPPPEKRHMVDAVSPSGMPIQDCLLAGFDIEPNHPSGGSFGPRACGWNFRRLMEAHPPYVDPVSSLAGAYMVNFSSYLKPRWNPDYSYDHLKPQQERYQLIHGIGAGQHFCQDLSLGLRDGFGGLLRRIRDGRDSRPADRHAFYDGLEHVVLGMQNWIARTADEAERQAQEEPDPELQESLRRVAAVNRRILSEPPATFHEACQWILWYQLAARMYNGSGSLGRLDVILKPYYDRDVAAGILDDQEAMFHLACLFVRDTAYIQLGGPDAGGTDVTNRLSYLSLEAAHALKIPVNIGVCVGRDVDPKLLERAVQILLEDRTGIPKFLGVDNTVQGFTRNGVPLSVARTRAYSGCHWSAVPGREYTINDCTKVNLARVFEVAFWELVDSGATPSVRRLWEAFSEHLARAMDIIRESLAFHMAHMKDAMPELVLDLLCYGPIEEGVDASTGVLEYNHIGVDAAALATVADSFAALEHQVEPEGASAWHELANHLKRDWTGEEGARARARMRSTPRYGSGNSLADDYAKRVADLFTRLTVERTLPNGAKLIPGLFSWANTIGMGKKVGATPNGRFAGRPISHGSNPDPGFVEHNAPTALVLAVASVQPGYGNAAPLQMEIDPGLAQAEEAGALVSTLITTHFHLGGTQINLNVVSKEKILEAHADPAKFPELVVRVTGFSAYFASLSPEFRQLVVDRILAEEAS